MKTSKVLEIIAINERLKWEHWPVYYIQMKLENWETITLWKKTKESIKVWDQISYEEIEPWKKRKEIKENPFQKRQFNQERQNLWAMIWMSYKLAFEIFYSKEEKNFQDTIKFANAIVEEAMKTYKEHEKNPA